MFFVFLLSVVTIWFVIKMVRKAWHQDHSEVEHILGKKTHRELTKMARRIESLYDRGEGKR